MKEKPHWKLKAIQDSLSAVKRWHKRYLKETDKKNLDQWRLTKYENDAAQLEKQIKEFDSAE